jgi:hypothetical protein
MSNRLSSRRTNIRNSRAKRCALNSALSGRSITWNGAQTCTAITNNGCAASRYLRLWVVPPR